MTRALCVVLAVALCTGWSTAQAVPPKLQLHPGTIKGLAKAMASANKEGHTPPSSLYAKAKEGIKSAAETVTGLTIITSVPVNLCRWYPWCDNAAARIGSSLGAKDPGAKDLHTQSDAEAGAD